MLGRIRANPVVRTALDVHGRFGEVEGGVLSAAVTLTLFLTLFPVLLVALAVLGFLAAGDAGLAADLVEQFRVGDDIADLLVDSIDAARGSRAATSVAGFLGMVWASLGLGGMVSRVCNRPWQLPVRGISGRFVALGWLVGAIVLLGGSIALTALLDVLPFWLAPLQVMASATLLGAFFLFTFRLLTNRPLALSEHLPGAVFGAVGVEILTIVGAVLLRRVVADRSALYGSIGVVLGLLGWLLVFGRLLVYAVTLNVVLHERAHGTVRVEVDAPRFPGEVPVRADRSATVEPRTTDRDDGA